MGDWIWVLITGLITFLAVSMIGGNPIIEPQPIPIQIFDKEQSKVTESSTSLLSKPQATAANPLTPGLEAAPQTSSASETLVSQIQNSQIEIWLPLVASALLILGWRIAHLIKDSLQKPPTPGPVSG